MAVLPCTAAVVEGVNWNVVPIPRRQIKNKKKIMILKRTP